jgi:hypothetical protein
MGCCADNTAAPTSPEPHERPLSHHSPQVRHSHPVHCSMGPKRYLDLQISVLISQLGHVPENVISLCKAPIILNDIQDLQNVHRRSIWTMPILTYRSRFKYFAEHQRNAHGAQFNSTRNRFISGDHTNKQHCRPSSQFRRE